MKVQPKVYIKPEIEVKEYEDGMEKDCRCCRPDYANMNKEELEKYFNCMKVGGIFIILLSFIVVGVIIGSVCGVSRPDCGHFSIGGVICISIMTFFSISPGGIILVTIANKNLKVISETGTVLNSNLN